MALNAVHLCWCQLALPEHGLDTLLLCRSIRCRQTCTPSILVGLATGQTANRARGGIKLFHLEAQGTTQFTSRVAVGGGVECETPAIVAQHASSTAANERPGIQHEIQAVHNACRHRLVVFETKVQLRHVGAHKRGGARGVDGHACTLQVHGIGEAVRRDGIGCCSRSMSTTTAVQHPGCTHAHPVILIDTHEVANVLGFPLQAPLVVPTLQKGHVRHFHDLALAWVHALCLHGGDLKKLAIEEIDALDAEATMARVSSSKL
mmetsp:Transcript_34874/g.64931  ORF Transcript_34874/g.64931 Transcript_34874/m.64931 type:complete len:262 (-) Transcript_34874:623-1408(-)